MLKRLSLVLALSTLMVAPCYPAGPQSKSAPKKRGLAAPMIAQWKAMPELNDGNHVKGSLVVSNQSDDDFDQTVVIEAINEHGRAVVIGYQHFPLAHHSTSVPIPFTMTLPPGHYQFHADAVAEVPVRQSVHRLHMQAPLQLDITTI